MSLGHADASSDLLGRFGLTPGDEAVWRFLMSNPGATGVEIRRQTGMSAAEYAETVDRLVDARLLREASGPTGLAVIDPALAVETHIIQAERKMAEQAEEFAALRALIPTLAMEYSRGRTAAGDLPGFEIIVGGHAIQRQIDLAAEHTSTDLRGLEHGPTAGEAYRSTHPGEVQLSLLKRGVRDRLIVAPHVLDHPANYTYFQTLQSLGHTVRTLPDIATRLMVFDHDLAVLPVDPTNLPLGAIFIRIRSLIDVLIMLWDQTWSIASPVLASSSDQLAPVDRAARILELLAIGTKDERIARTLGIGARTVRREVAEIRRSLGVSSRAEIVAAAVRRGWL